MGVVRIAPGRGSSLVGLVCLKIGHPTCFSKSHGKSHVLFGIKSVVFWVVLYITHCATNPASRNSSHPHKCQLSSKNKVLLHKHLQKRSHANLVGKTDLEVVVVEYKRHARQNKFQILVD